MYTPINVCLTPNTIIIHNYVFIMSKILQGCLDNYSLYDFRTKIVEEDGTRFLIAFSRVHR